MWELGFSLARETELGFSCIGTEVKGIEFSALKSLKWYFIRQTFEVENRKKSEEELVC